MNGSPGVIAGRTLVIVSIALMFLAYSNFAPTALSSDQIADYVKNHFVREIIFGVALAVWAIRTALRPVTRSSLVRLVVIGSIVVLPFWIASMFGWSTGGIEMVWGDKIQANGAFLLHGPQTVMFYLGIVVLWLSSKRAPGA